MAFLGEIQLMEPGKEHRVQVDIQEIKEILAVLACKGIGRPIAGGECVHEGVQ